MILTGTRVYARLGVEHRTFAWLGAWNERSQSPTYAIAAQAAIALLFMLSVGTQAGQALIDGSLQRLRLPVVPWEEYFGGFEALVAATAHRVLGILLADRPGGVCAASESTAATEAVHDPYYPITPMLFCVTCGFMLCLEPDLCGCRSLLPGRPCHAAGCADSSSRNAACPNRGTDRDMSSQGTTESPADCGVLRACRG